MTAESILYIFKFPKVCILIVAFIERIDTVTVSHVLKENLTVSKIDVNCQFNCNKSSLTIDN